MCPSSADDGQYKSILRMAMSVCKRECYKSVTKKPSGVTLYKECWTIQHWSSALSQTSCYIWGSFGPHPVSILQSLAMAESSVRSIQQKRATHRGRGRGSLYYLYGATTEKTRVMLGDARTIMYFFVQYETEIAEYKQTNPLTDTIISSVWAKPVKKVETVGDR